MTFGINGLPHFCIHQTLLFRIPNQTSVSNWKPSLWVLTLPAANDKTKSKGHFFITLMKHIAKIMTLLAAISALWIGLLQISVIPHGYTWLLPVYFIVSLGCYGLLMVGVGLMQFPTCPQEALLLQQDIVEAKEFLKQKGVDVGYD